MRVEVLGAHERRRRWVYEDKVRILEETFEQGASVCGVARRHGIAHSLLFTWRRQAREGRLGGEVAAAPVFVPVAIAAPDAAPAPCVPAVVAPAPVAVADSSPAPRRSRGRRTGMIEINLGSGRRLRVDRDVDAEALRRVLDALGAR